MANTFKVKTNGAMPTSGSAETLYTVPSSTTTVVIGLLLCNIHTSAVTVDVSLAKSVSIPVGSTLELLTGGKVVMQTTDVLKINCSVQQKIDATLSILEIT